MRSTNKFNTSIDSRINSPLTALLPCSNVSIVVGLHSLQELLSAFRVLDVLDTDVYPLFNVAVADDLVNDDADGRGGDVVDDTGSSAEN